RRIPDRVALLNDRTTSRGFEQTLRLASVLPPGTPSQNTAAHRRFPGSSDWTVTTAHGREIRTEILNDVPAVADGRWCPLWRRSPRATGRRALQAVSRRAGAIAGSADTILGRSPRSRFPGLHRVAGSEAARLGR